VFLELQVQHDPVTVSLDVVLHSTSAKLDARMSEISMTGCYVDSKGQRGRLGETIDFKVHLPSGPWVSLQAELVSDDYPIGFGLSFTNLSDEDRRLIAEVVAAHGGKPVAPPASKPAVVTATPVVTNSPRKRGRVLVADDDSLTLRLVSAIVNTQGYEVVAVSDGLQAQNVLKQDANFCAAIFDMMMPHLQGLDLILYMKADARLRDIPVGMITAEQDPKVWDDSIAAGARVFLPKPFSPPQMQMVLRMLISKP
jgi:CheY-like chemotaxis protein